MQAVRSPGSLGEQRLLGPPPWASHIPTCGSRFPQTAPYCEPLDMNPLPAGVFMDPLFR